MESYFNGRRADGYVGAAKLFDVFTTATVTVGKRLGTDDISVPEVYPGYTSVPMPCREIMFNGGTLVVTLDDGVTDVTIPADYAKIPLGRSVSVIKATSTATSVMIAWD